MERTKSRPLASGQIPLLHTWIFLGAQLSVGLAILLQLNWYTILLGASSLSTATYIQFVLFNIIFLLLFRFGCDISADEKSNLLASNDPWNGI